MFIITDKAKAKGGGIRRKVGGVGVMKGNELKLKEIEASHTLGGAGEGRVQGKGKWREFRCYTGVKHFERN